MGVFCQPRGLPPRSTSLHPDCDVTAALGFARASPSKPKWRCVSWAGVASQASSWRRVLGEPGRAASESACHVLSQRGQLFLHRVASERGVSTAQSNLRLTSGQAGSQWQTSLIWEILFWPGLMEGDPRLGPTPSYPAFPKGHLETVTMVAPLWECTGQGRQWDLGVRGPACVQAEGRDAVPSAQL